jgi:hypothetical protein
VGSAKASGAMKVMGEIAGVSVRRLRSGGWSGLCACARLTELMNESGSLGLTNWERR